MLTIFIHFTPKGQQKHPHISARQKFLQKDSLTIVVLRWTINSLGRNAPSSQKQRCHNDFAKKQPELGKNGTFLFFGLGIAIFKVRWHFSLEKWFFNAELQSQVSFFEKTSNGPRYGVLISALRGNRNKKLGDKIAKQWAKDCPSKF